MMEPQASSCAEINEMVYAVINNIPTSHHSADLRKYFSIFVENEAFDCFHFRHRPELQSTKQNPDINVVSEERNSTSTKNKDGTFCCIIRLTKSKFIELLRTFHQRHWKNEKGDPLPSKCLISQ